MDDFPIALFMAKIKKIDGHWIWDAALGGQGNYGIFTWVKDKKRITKAAHRWAYMYFIGPIPEGKILDHKCRIHECVNPFDCLEPVTNQENTDRGLRAKQRMCGKGLHLMEGHNILQHPRGRMCRECANERTRKWRRGDAK